MSWIGLGLIAICACIGWLICIGWMGQMEIKKEQNKMSLLYNKDSICAICQVEILASQGYLVLSDALNFADGKITQDQVRHYCENCTQTHDNAEQQEKK